MADFFSSARIRSSVFADGKDLPQIKNSILSNVRRNGLSQYIKLYNSLNDYCKSNPSQFSYLKKIWNLTKERSQNNPRTSICDLFVTFINSKKWWKLSTFLNKIVLEYKKFLLNTPSDHVDGLNQLVASLCRLINTNIHVHSTWEKVAEYKKISPEFASLMVSVGETLSLPLNDKGVDSLCRVTKLWEKYSKLPENKLQSVNIKPNDLQSFINLDDKNYPEVDPQVKPEKIIITVNQICDKWWSFTKLRLQGSRMFIQINSIMDIKKFKLNIVELIKSTVNQTKFNVNWNITEPEEHTTTDKISKNIFYQPELGITNDDY